ncbi:hypothetical protein P9112_010784 [Eukaryota sp. TZLM1-RC]
MYAHRSNSRPRTSFSTSSISIHNTSVIYLQPQPSEPVYLEAKPPADPLSSLLSQKRPLFSFTSPQLVVGDLTTTSSTTVTVYSNRLEYFFRHHLLHSKVHMIMRFEHLKECHLVDGLFRFKLTAKLKCFPQHYDPFINDHFLGVKYSNSKIGDRLIELINS